MKPFRSDTILLLVSNPVDVLTSLAQELSGLPKSQVMGSGTFLDSVRLRRLLANKFEVRIRRLLDRSLSLAKLGFR
jgi:L-lactate dehydrogenase